MRKIQNYTSLNLRLSPQDNRQLEQLARHMRRSKSSTLREAIRMAAAIETRAANQSV